MTDKIAKISEIFNSIQGEGPYVGCRQIFIRFCGCNILCDYCDTEFDKGEKYTVKQLVDKIKTFDLQAVHSVSITGGEPLIHYEFLSEFLPELKKLGLKIYLETNGTLPESLNKIIDCVDIVSMDFKLDSSAKIGDLYTNHDMFLDIAVKNKKEVFAKLVFDDSLRDFEINECVSLAKKYGILLVLQPKMHGKDICVSHDDIVNTFNKFTKLYHNTRLIGQVHKFFDII